MEQKRIDLYPGRGDESHFFHVVIGFRLKVFLSSVSKVSWSVYLERLSLLSVHHLHVLLDLESLLLIQLEAVLLSEIYSRLLLINRLTKILGEC